MKVAVYCRVSTDQQELEQQVAACRRYCEFKGLPVGEVFAEVGSGKSFARPRFQEMLTRLRAGEFSAVVAFRFDRLGRNSREVCLLFDELEGRGIQIHSVNESLDTSTPIGRAMRDIIVRLAQLERENIAEATKHRLQALKALGKKLGRKPMEFDVEEARELRRNRWSWAKIAERVGAKASTIRLRLQQKGAAKPDHNVEGSPAPAPVGVSCKPETPEAVV